VLKSLPTSLGSVKPTNAAIQSRRSVLSRYFEKRADFIFRFLVLGLLLFSANVGLLNRHLGFQGQLQQNLFSPRDLCVGLLIAFIATQVSVWQNFAGNRFATVIKFLLHLTPMAAVIGYANGATAGGLLQGLSIMGSWVIALALANFARSINNLKFLFIVITATGILVSLGVFVETFSRGSIAVVTPATEDLALTFRSTPSGWPAMLLAFSMLSIFVLRRTDWTTFLLSSSGCFLIGIAAMLTQSRTLLVSMVVSSVLYLLFQFLHDARKVNWTGLALFYLSGGIVLSITLAIGEIFYSESFATYFIDRYSVLSQSEGAKDILERDPRREEFDHILYQHFLPSPIVGCGLGTDVFGDGTGATTHNIIGYFMLRYGTLGVIAWLVFCGQTVHSLWKASSDRSSTNWLNQGFALGLQSLVIGAMFGSIFAQTYGVQQAMINLGALMAYQNRPEQRLSKTREQKLGHQTYLRRSPRLAA
jgi:hypothetical protein